MNTLIVSIVSITALLGVSAASAETDAHKGHGTPAAAPATPAADPHAGHKMSTPTVKDGPWSYKGRKNPEPYTKGRWDMVPTNATTGMFVSTGNMSKAERCRALLGSTQAVVDRATRKECGASEIVVGDAGSGHGAKAGDAKAAAAAPDHGAHWMAPPDAAQRKNPVRATPAAIAAGKATYDANCASCHGVSGKGDGPASAALPTKPADLAVMVGEHPDGDLAWKIANGRGAMPAWKGTLSEKQIWEVVRYTKTLGMKKVPRGKKPDDHTGHKH